MKKLMIGVTLVLTLSCQKKEQTLQQNANNKVKEVPALSLSQSEANRLLEMPLACVVREYPNKLNQVINTAADIQSPKQLHPAFYGCFDWHSSVHGHWSMVTLLTLYPNLEKAEEAKVYLQQHITEKNISEELAYFTKEYNNSYERTYGWAWLLKLSEALYLNKEAWSQDLYQKLEPLTQHIVQSFISYLPKLKYPLRIGTHNNTAFALSFAMDYAESLKNEALKQAIVAYAQQAYAKDKNGPLEWEPNGTDFLSPCFEEVDLMSKVLETEAFEKWLAKFLPTIAKADFQLDVALVSDRNDGHLVHLDGLNFSRAWCLYSLSKKYKQYAHLKHIAYQHLSYALPNVVGDGYEGGHWLASFAIYALSKAY